MSALEFQPTTFGRYVLHQLLAEGGMAEVFLAEQHGAEGVSKLVAVKRMLPHLSKQPEFVTMFLDEARTASRLSHPNVVQVFDFGEVDGRYYLAMEYLAGENLSAVSRQAGRAQKPIPVQLVQQILIGACDGLHYAHEFEDRGVKTNLVHRDISPSNIVITYQGGIKVIDFGIARAVDRRQERTETGVVKGKYPYCSPEQLQSSDLDRRTDIFALGVVLYELLTGERLFKRETDLKTCMAVLHDPVPNVCVARPDAPVELNFIVQRCLEKNRADRYQTALELRKALEHLVLGPPVRVDEYMLGLFGADYVAERTNLASSISKAPTGADMSKQSYDPLQPTKEVTPSLLLTQEVGSTRTVGVTPSGIRKQKLQQPAPPQDGAPNARSRPPRVALGLAAVAVVAVGVWFGYLQLSANQAQKNVEPPPTPLVPPVPVVPPVAVTGASLEVTTQPSGATVTVCGRPAPGPAPTRVAELPAGQCLIAASLAGYKPIEQVVTLTAGAATSVVLTLVREATRLEVEAAAGVRVVVDGVDHGEVRSIELEPGEHSVKALSAGFVPREEKVTLAAGETKKLELKLVALKKAAPGTLDVSCVPWCRVFLDGVDVGKPSPIVGLKVSSGTHKLKLEHPPSGRSKELVLQIKPGESARESASFK